MKQLQRVLRCGLLVLTGHELPVDDHVRIVRRHSGVGGARFFQHRLRKVRDEKAALEQPLQFLIPLEGVAGDTAAAHAVGNVPEGDRAVADGPDDLVARPKVLERLSSAPVR